MLGIFFITQESPNFSLGSLKHPSVAIDVRKVGHNGYSARLVGQVADMLWIVM